LISVKHKGETTLDNLRPICEKCNQDMGSEDWDPYVEAKRISIEWVATSNTKVDISLYFYTYFQFFHIILKF